MIRVLFELYVKVFLQQGDLLYFTVIGIALCNRTWFSSRQGEILFVEK